MDRRALLKLAGLAPLVAAVPRLPLTEGQRQAPDAKADYTVRIGTGLVELSPTHIISTTLYNDQFPGPLLRFKEGQHVVVDVHNDTDTPELVHWHGKMVTRYVDGSSEEGTTFVPRWQSAWSPPSSRSRPAKRPVPRRATSSRKTRSTGPSEQ